MGYDTTYMGWFSIDPPLNAVETTWLRAYAASDRGAYPTDPFGLAMNPRAEAAMRWRDGARPNRTAAAGVPGEHCDWAPCDTGCHLEWHKADRSNTARFWLPYLIYTFIGPDATAKGSGQEDFAEFTFDHSVSGVVAAQSSMNGRIVLLVMRDNRLHRVTVAPGSPMDADERPYLDAPEDDDAAHLVRIQEFAAAHGFDDTEHYVHTVLGHRVRESQSHG